MTTLPTDMVVLAWAQDRMVSNCHEVSQAAVREAIAAGADSVDAVGIATKAGTGCGSCKGELAQLLPRPARSSPVPIAVAS